jgi:hypothetical protein
LHDTIYRHLKLVKQGCADALKRQKTLGLVHGNCVDIAIEKAVFQFFIGPPHLEQQKMTIKLTEALGVDLNAGCVRFSWMRNNVNTKALRVE